MSFLTCGHTHRCSGNESVLSECDGDPTDDSSDLDHSGDVGVDCRSPTPCSFPLVRHTTHTALRKFTFRRCKCYNSSPEYSLVPRRSVEGKEPLG